MDKLTRYKRNKLELLQRYTNFMLKFTIDEPFSRKGLYDGYKYLRTKINITKKIPSNYKINLDVCNID